MVRVVEVAAIAQNRTALGGADTDISSTTTHTHLHTNTEFLYVLIEIHMHRLYTIVS